MATHSMRHEILYFNHRYNHYKVYMGNLGLFRVIFDDPVRCLVHVAHLGLFRFVELLYLYVIIMIGRFHAPKPDILD
jgi:hypothetical protein